MSTPKPQNPSSAEIAAEIARTRARLSRGLAVLDRDYALRHLIVRAARLARNAASSAHGMNEALRRDAVPLAFIAIGLGWLSLAGRSAGTELLGRVTSTLAALQRLGQEFGLLSTHAEPAAAPSPLPAPHTGNDPEP